MTRAPALPGLSCVGGRSAGGGRPRRRRSAAREHGLGLADLLESAIEAAGLAIEIARLRVEVRRRLADVERSRARIVTAGYEERRRLERDLHDGAQQRLVSIGLALRHIQGRLPTPSREAEELDETVAELGDAIEELRELARGVAGRFLTAELAMALARAATARVADLVEHAPKVLIIRDTRESGEMLEAAVAAGVAAAGGEALLGGVLPTPGAPLLIRRHGLDLGVVLSASHNPYEDDGIKFGGDGFKLTDDIEAEIEEMLEAAHVEAGAPGTGAEDPGAPGHPTPRIGHIQRFHGALEDYLRALHERFEGLDLSGLRFALDCANGAT